MGGICPPGHPLSVDVVVIYRKWCMRQIRYTERYTDRQIDRQTDGWTDAWMDG